MNKRYSLILSLALIALLMVPLIVFGAEKKGFEVVSDNNVGIGGVAVGTSAIVQTVTLQDKDADNDPVTITKIEVNGADGTAVVADFDSIEVLDENDNVIFSETPTGSGANWSVSKSGLSIVVPDDGTYTLKVRVKVADGATMKARIRPTVVVTMSEGGTSGITRSATDGTDEYITFTREDKGLEVVSDDNVNAGKVAPGSSVIVQTITLKDHDPDSDPVKVTSVKITAEGPAGKIIANADINSIEILDQNDSVVGSDSSGSSLGATITLSGFTVPDDGQNTLKVRLTLASGITSDIGNLIRFQTKIFWSEGTKSGDVTVTDGTGEYIGYKTQDTGLEQTIDQNVNAGVLTSGQTAVVQKVKLVDNDNDTDPVDIDTVTVDFAHCANNATYTDIQSVKILDGAGTVVGIGTVQTSSATTGPIDIVGYQIPDDGSDVMQVQVTLTGSPASGKVICPVVKIETSEGGSTNTTYAADGTQEVISGAGADLGLEVVDDQNVSANPIPETLTVVQRVTLKDQDRSSSDHDPVTITGITLTNAYPGYGGTAATLTSSGDLISAEVHIDGDTTATYDISSGTVSISPGYQINDGHTATLTLKVNFKSAAVGRLFQPQLAIEHKEPSTGSAITKLAVSGTVMQVGMGNNDMGLEVVSDNNVAKGDVMPGAASRTRVMTVKLADNDNDSDDVTVTGITVAAGAKLSTVYLLDKNGATIASAVEGSTEIPTDATTATFTNLTWTIPDDTTNELRVEIIYKDTATPGTLARPQVTLTVDEGSTSSITETATDGSPETIGLSLADMGPETVSDHNLGTYIAPGSAATVMQIDLADSDGDADTHDVTVTKVELTPVTDVTNVTSSDITKVELLDASGNVIALSSWASPMTLTIPGGLKISDDTSTNLKVRVTTSASAVVGRTFAFKAVVTYNKEDGTAGTESKTVYEGTLDEIGAPPDTTPPTFSDKNPGDGSTVNNPQPTVSVRITDPGSGVDSSSIQMTIAGNNYKVGDTGVSWASNVFSVNLATAGQTLANGSVAVSVTAKDNAGNSGSTSWSFTVSTGVSQSHTFLAGWNLISLPLDPVDPSPSAVFDEVTGTLYLYSYNGTGWDTVANGKLTAVGPLGGYWLWLSATTTVSVTGTPVTGDQTKQLGPKGWQMIGVPYQVAWGSGSGGSISVVNGSQTKTLAEAVSAGWIYDTIWAYDTSSNSWIKTKVSTGTTLDPWKGYWIYTYVDNLELRFSETAGPVSGPPSVTSAPQGLITPMAPPVPPVPISSSEAAAQLEFGNYPNPVRDVHTTTFEVKGAAAALVEAIKVEIYDLSGRLVYSSGEVAGTSLDWHTDNDYGEYLANGVYLYKMYAKVAGRWVVSKVKKLAILR